MPTIFPFYSRLFINKTILFRRLSPIITQVFYFTEYIVTQKKPVFFVDVSIKGQIIWPMLVPRISYLSNVFDEDLEDTAAT